MAADTAVTTGSTVYHGEKLHHYSGAHYRVVVACSGDLTCARMASQQIRDSAATLPNPSVADLKKKVIEVLVDVYAKHVFPHWQAGRSDAPRFSLIIGLEAREQFELLVSADTAVEEVGTYAFQGSGTDIAQYLGETLMRSRGNDLLPFPTAAAVQLIIETFRIAKQYGEAVGLDTVIVAWRTERSLAPFPLPLPQRSPQSELAIIQENFKAALWAALDRSSTMADRYISSVVQLTDSTLREMRQHTLAQSDRATRFIRYWLMPTTAEWQMEDLDPNAQLSREPEGA